MTGLLKNCNSGAPARGGARMGAEYNDGMKGRQGGGGEGALHWRALGFEPTTLGVARL